MHEDLYDELLRPFTNILYHLPHVSHVVDILKFGWCR
jgi:hypothetical protein